MPIYEYLCSKCGKKFERIQKFSDAPVATHDECGGAVERLVSAPGLHFKGSGWYITDYAKGSSSGSGESKSESKKEGSSSSESKPAETKSSEGSSSGSSSSSESKPAATTSKKD